ncbi:MAG: alpha/beta hydrolase [Micrococcales bacterium]
MSPSPLFANAPFTFEEMTAAREAESAATFARYQVPTDITVVEKSLGPVRFRIYRPDNCETQPALLIWIHGGAFIGGNMDMPEGQITSYEISRRANALVIQIDYRVCTDEIRFPVPQLDSLAVTEWAINNRADLGFDPTRVFIGGASAGACIAGSVAMMLRNRKIPMAGVFPIYAIGHRNKLQVPDELQSKVDAHFGSPQRGMEGHNEWLDPDPEKTKEFYVWPADATEYEDLPKHYFINAEFDLLRASAEPWAANLRAAGVPVEEQIMPGSIHAFLNQVPSETPVQDLALSQMAEIIRGAQ